MALYEFSRNLDRGFCNIYQKFTLFACVFVLIITQQSSKAIEVITSEYDTFITQALPNNEMSSLRFLALSRKKGQYSIAYLPFDLETYKYGITPANDTIIDASLSFFIKIIPDSAKPNQSTEDTQNQTDNIITIDVYGITDKNTFLPYSIDSIVSWNGKNKTIAPKHDSQNYKLNKLGITKLGEIILDTNNFEYNDGDRIDFTSDEFIKYLSFCFGIEQAKNMQSPFLSSLTQIPNATIILKQSSGKSDVFIYSANSLDLDFQPNDNQSYNIKNQSYNINQNAIDNINNLLEENPFNLTEEEINNHKNNIKQYYADPKNKGFGLPIPSAGGSTTKAPALEEYSQMQFIMRNQIIDNIQMDKILNQNQSDTNEIDINLENQQQTTKDFRPRINFEFITN